MGRRLINRQYKLGSRAPNMLALTGQNGVGNLSDSITINGTTVAATAVYRGGEADSVSGTWPAHIGETLTETGTGAAIDYDVPAYGNGPGDKAVRFNEGQYFASPNNAYAEITDQDFIITVALSVREIGTPEIIFGKRNHSGLVVGWLVFLQSDGTVYLVMDGTSGGVSVITGALLPNQTSLVAFVVDKSGSAQGYINGQTSGSPQIVSSVGSLICPDELMMGKEIRSTTESNVGIIYASIHMADNWLDSHLQPDWVLEDFQRWSGIYATKATGTAAPNSFARTTSGYMEKYDPDTGVTDLINCGAGLPRVGRKLDASGVAFEGMLIETQATNLLTYSEDSTQWTAIDAGDVLGAAAGVAPNNESTMVSLVADATDGQHGTAESNTPTLAAVLTTYSRFFIKGDNDHVWLENTTVANTQSWFNLDTGAVGTLGSAATSRISGPYYSDLGEVYRCEITFTGTVAAHTFNWGSSASDNDETFAGDAAAINCYTWGAQVEAGSKASSYYKTAGAAATRTADKLQYNGDNVTAGQGTLKCEVLLDNVTPTADLNIVNISDGGSADEAIACYVDSGGEVPIYSGVDSTVAQWTITGATDICTGSKVEQRLIWQSNDARQYSDGAANGTPDTSCTVPTALDEIDVGQDVSDANQLNGWIRNLAIYGFGSSDV